MIVAVQNEFGAVRGEHLAKFRAVGQPPQIAVGRALRRVMDEHDAEQSAGLLERLRQARKLRVAEFAGRHERPGRQRRGQRDQRDAVRAGARTERCRLGAPSSPRI